MPLIRDEERDRLWRYIAVICREVGCEPLAVGGIADHVHLLVDFSSTATIAGLMKRVKGGSSHFVSAELRQGDWFAWQAHYGAFAVDPNGVGRVVAYIHDQDEHHRDGTDVPDWEQTELIEDDMDAAESNS
jgi:putative transposase